jgi:hypothetical protein
VHASVLSHVPVSLSAVCALTHSHSLCCCLLSALSLTRTRWLNLHGAQVRSSGDNWVACAEGFCSAYDACPTASVALLAPPLLSLCLPHRFCCFACLCALLDPLPLPALHGFVRVRFLLSTSHNITTPCALHRSARPQCHCRLHHVATLTLSLLRLRGRDNIAPHDYTIYVRFVTAAATLAHSLCTLTVRNPSFDCAVTTLSK